MAQIIRPLNDEQKSMGVTGKCSFCFDTESSAYWSSSQGFVEVCRECATMLLPALIADAVVIPRNFNSQNYYDNKLDEVKGAYWRAIASAVQYNARQIEEEKRAAETEFEAAGAES